MTKVELLANRTGPFIKWAGGKRALALVMLRAAPENIRGYWEPFVGGGAVFFALARAGRIPRAYLSDTNHDLILTYQVVRDQVAALIEHLRLHAREHHANPDYYYSVRASQPTDDLGRASRFIYLNKTCYNGLYRVNCDGHFNVPKGRYLDPVICDTRGLQQASRALAIAELQVCSFENIEPGSGDFVYCDPPYDGCFTAYQSGGFDEHHQRSLSSSVSQWNNRGAKVIVSNADTSLIRQLYANYHLSVVQAGRVIGCKAASRGQVNELLIANYRTPKGPSASASGLKANKRGQSLENFVRSLCSDSYQFVERKHFESLKTLGRPIFTSQYSISKDIYGKDRKVDFILYRPGRWPQGLIIQCKWQGVSGSVEQKYPFEVECIKQDKVPAIIVLDGSGYSKGAQSWLKQQVDGRYLLHVFSQGELQRLASRGHL